jgi:two-component system OmpR family sensor kinase/two-component system sensor histidine kinase BaeS
MNRLWVRLSVMIGGTLFLVFFMQFAAIMLAPDPVAGGPGDGPNAEERAEVAARIVDFMLLSAVVGVVGGGLIGWVVSAPVNELARVAQRVGAGDLRARVRPRGSQEMVELGRAFNRMADDLQASQAARTDLMADVSHELRTPLTVLEGNLRAALDRVYPLDDAELANLYGQTRHLIRIVNDLRELSLAEARQLPLQLAEVDLPALIAETLQAVEPLATEKSIALTSTAAALPPLPADPSRLRQVLFNLLTNALRHTPRGGHITVAAEAEARDIRLTVADDGEGLTPQELLVAFDRFYRADKSRSRETGGAGLGLAIVKAIAEAHGGRVEARSAGKGRGAEFAVVLPLRPSKTVDPAAQVVA